MIDAIIVRIDSIHAMIDAIIVMIDSIYAMVTIYVLDHDRQCKKIIKIGSIQ